MNDDERARMEGVPWPLVRAAARNPRVQSALHRHVFGGRLLPEVLRAAYLDLVAHVAELCDLAGVAAPAAPPWPEGPADALTQARVDALLGVLRLHHDAARAAERTATARLPAFRVVLPAGAATLGSAEFRAALRDAILEAARNPPAPAPPPWTIRTRRLE